MSPKRVFQTIVVVAILAASFASTGRVLAWTGDCSSYVTVQPGDTLSAIASACGTTVEAMQAANPGLGSYPQAGQVLYMPTGYMPGQAYYPQQTGSNTYIVQLGDTLGEIAARNGLSLNDVLAANPWLGNANWICPGQVINLPAYYGAPASSYYYPPSGYYGPTSYPPSYPAPSYATQGYAPAGSIAPQVCPPDCYTGNPSIIYPKYSPALGWRGLKVTYKYGLTVRTAPARFHGEIAGLYVEAIKDSTWTYLKSSTTVDAEGFVWVQVVLPRVVDGYETGWLVVKDALGNYYTSPNIDP